MLNTVHTHTAHGAKLLPPCRAYIPSALIFFFWSIESSFGKMISKQITSSPPQMPSPGTTFESPGATICAQRRAKPQAKPGVPSRWK